MAVCWGWEVGGCCKGSGCTGCARDTEEVVVVVVVVFVVVAGVET